jgi:hypothetical protein
MKVNLRKKTLHFLFMVFLISFLVTGCGGDGGSEGGSVDVDLSALSSIMLFAEMTNIMNDPQNYLGQTIRIDGEYINFHSEESDRYLHFVIILDEQGCCSQGFEFRVSDEFQAPEDFLDEEDLIQVVGVFQSCDESGRTIYYLAVEELNLL